MFSPRCSYQRNRSMVLACLLVVAAAMSATATTTTSTAVTAGSPGATSTANSDYHHDASTSTTTHSSSTGSGTGHADHGLRLSSSRCKYNLLSNGTRTVRSAADAKECERRQLQLDSDFDGVCNRAPVNTTKLTAKLPDNAVQGEAYEGPASFHAPRKDSGVRKHGNSGSSSATGSSANAAHAAASPSAAPSAALPRSTRCTGVDNCPMVFNPQQHDADGDGKGNACDTGSRRRVCSGFAWCCKCTRHCERGLSGCSFPPESREC